MHRRTAATRLVMLTTLAALTASFVGTVTVQARDARSTDRHIRSQGDPARDAAGVRAFRHSRRAQPACGDRQGVSLRARPPTARRHPLAGGAPGRRASVARPDDINGDPAITQATEFDGLQSLPKTSTDGEPPDPWVAAGPDHVFQAVNTSFRDQRSLGERPATIDMFDFFGLGEFYSPGEVAYFDPRVIYDSLHARWIAIEASFDCYPENDLRSVVGTG